MNCVTRRKNFNVFSLPGLSIDKKSLGSLVICAATKVYSLLVFDIDQTVHWWNAVPNDINIPNLLGQPIFLSL